LRAKASDTTIAAAPPHVGGQAIRRVSTPSHRRVHHVFGRHDVAEHRERIACRVLARLRANAGERFELRAVLAHVRLARARELANRRGHFRVVDEFVRQADRTLERGRAIRPFRQQRSRLHEFEAEGERAIDRAAFHGLARKPERRRTRRAVVVDVDDRNARHADAIKRFLAARRIAVHITRVSLLDGLEVEAGVGERIADRDFAHHVVRLACTRLLERNHSHARDIHLATHVLLLQ